MSYLKDRSLKIKSNIVQHGNSFIPLLEALDITPLDYVASYFQTYCRSNYDVNKISVVDPYFNLADLERVTMLFGGASKNILEVITKFEAYKREEEDKRETIELIVQQKNDLVSNGVFARISFFHSNISMHDRYIIFWKNEQIFSVFTIGGSINQEFQDFIQIHKVSDIYFIDSVNIYYEKLKSSLEGEY